jgi:DNA-binding CsgD family transcriptional regulator/tetratricopeptide (TPR) repeat protein
MPSLPGPLRLTPAFPFVGRSRELARLRALMPRAGSEGRRVALIGGEPGSGKSRLVREFAHEAAADGALVLYGACDAVVHTPYRPFVEALEQLGRTADPEQLRADLGPSGGELTRLLPDLPRRVGGLPVGGLPVPAAADADTERHRLHTAVADLLVAVGRRRPLLLVLEDGHWADAPTLWLLRHLAHSAADARMLLVATFRDAEADVPAELAEALVDLRRAEGLVRLRLTGLSGEEISELVRVAAGGELGAELPALARALGELTQGNAFLVTELWRSLLETGALVVADGTATLVRPLDELGTPDSVRELVSRRLARLEPSTVQLLELAAVAGGRFDIGVLRRAAGLEDGRLLDALDEALRCGMLEEVPGRGLAYRFAHELVRRALYDRLTGLRRAELHLRVGEALEAGATRQEQVEPAALAHHFAVAAPLGHAARAVDHNLRAARAAMGALAFDEAATCLRTALELGIDDAGARASAQLELGTAHHRAGRAADALEAFAAAAAAARELGDAALLARAAIGFEDACWRPGIADRGAVELLEEAARALGDEDSALRVGVLAGLQRALSYRGEHGRSATFRVKAVATARRLRDRRGLAQTLMRAYWAKGTTPMAEILEMLAEARELGRELRDLEIEVEALAWRVPALMSLGDLDGAARAQRELLALAGGTRQPFMLHVAEHYGSAIALCRGRFADAEAAAERSRDWSRLLSGGDPAGVYGIQMFGIRREQGRLAELAPVVRVLEAGGSRDGAWRPGLAALLAELGMEDEARRQLARIGEQGLDEFRDNLWLASLAYLADACAAVGDPRVAALVRPELEAHAGSVVMVGHGVGFYGAADRYLGMLAATLGDTAAAARHFEAAVALDRRIGAPVWLAHTFHEYGRLLLRAPGGDTARAGQLLGEATALAERIGMPSLLARLGALGSPPAGPAALPDGLSPREVEILRLVARGRSNREIGDGLFISEHTAANHVRSILRKTGCQNRTEAASYAHRHALVEA